MIKSLQSRGSDLANTFIQLEILNQVSKTTTFTSFTDKLSKEDASQYSIKAPEIFQINIGKLCNQTCAHCHVDAGPDRKYELMSKANLERCLTIIANTKSIHTVDITGGAPEMHPHFRWFVAECSQLGKKIINRCNLTIIVANPKYHDLPHFFAEHNIEIIASLPYFNKMRTDKQRGDGVFEDSIRALKMLNMVGYGQTTSKLKLHLVHNPQGAYLAGGQKDLENEFKRQLKRQFDIDFNQLFVITNLPISRFLEYLLQSGNYESYMQTLIDAYNPNTLQGLMCRNTISVSWEGYLYDCDFNQMLDLKVASSVTHIESFDAQILSSRNIVFNQHCFGCTAGAGSSCGGEISA